MLKDGICGRIGGDEFVGVVLKKPGINAESIRKRIAAACSAYNKCSGKPYYVEISVGVKEFVCSEDMDFSELIQKADSYMYAAKKFRRVSVRR